MPLRRQVAESTNYPAVQAVALIVDDDVSVRKSTQVLLRASGITSVCFATAEEFLSFLDRSEMEEIFLGLILDVNLPGTSGFELLTELNYRGKQIPTIMMTGRQDDETVRRAEAASVVLLGKPLPSGALVAWLRGLTR